MKKGIVKWFSSEKGFGFIMPEDGSKDLFVHHSQINSADHYASLKDGENVQYEVGSSPKGACANNVSVI